MFDAYTDAEKQKIWFSILDENPGIVEIEVDLRVGGTQTAVWGPGPDTLFRETQTFLVIDRPHRLVTESTGSTPGRRDDDHARRGHLRGGRRRDAGDGRAERVPGPEIRDFFATEVWVGAFDRIEAYLRRRAGTVAS